MPLLRKEDKGGGMMERLTTNKDISEMGMYELAHNACYIKDGVARYRDFETDIDARDLARELAWMLADIELSSYDDNFDEEMLENLQYDITKEPIGLIALFYRNLWAMADLRERLKEYEDLEEQGLLLRLPCKVGDTVYCIYERYTKCSENEQEFDEYSCQGCECLECDSHKELYVQSQKVYGLDWIVSNLKRFGKTVFLTQAEAEQKLKEMESD